MSFKEVGILRKSGELDKALEMAKKDYESNPDDIWNKRSLAWVYYSMIKSIEETRDIESFSGLIKSIKELELSAEEDMYFENLSWAIGKFIYGFKGFEQETGNLKKVFNQIKDIPLKVKTDAYTFVLKGFYASLSKDIAIMGEVIEWWGISNLQESDFEGQEYKGRQMMSIAEKVSIVYGKSLLLGDIVPSKDASAAFFGFDKREPNKEKIQRFIPFLDRLLLDHPKFKYSGYYKAKLLVVSGGSKEDSLAAFLPFAKKNSREFWVWDIFSEIYSDDKEQQFSCLSRALACGGQMEFLLNVKLKYLKLLIEKKFYSEAKLELNEIVKIRNANEWKIGHFLTEQLSSDWYDGSEVAASNEQFYKNNSKKAEVILYADILTEFVLVDFVNAQKEMFNFIRKGDKKGFSKDFGNENQLKKGDLIEVRITSSTEDGFCKLLSINKVKYQEVEGLIEVFKGEVRIPTDRNFGFLKKAFISPSHMEQNNFKDGDSIEALVRRDYNKKENRFVWVFDKVVS